MKLSLSPYLPFLKLWEGSGIDFGEKKKDFLHLMYHLKAANVGFQSVPPKLRPLHSDGLRTTTSTLRLKFLKPVSVNRLKIVKFPRGTINYARLRRGLLLSFWNLWFRSSFLAPVASEGYTSAHLFIINKHIRRLFVVSFIVNYTSLGTFNSIFRKLTSRFYSLVNSR